MCNEKILHCVMANEETTLEVINSVATFLSIDFKRKQVQTEKSSNLTGRLMNKSRNSAAITH